MIARALGLALGVGACAGPGAAPIDAAGPGPCLQQSLELGRCVLVDGNPCTGALDEVRRFSSVAAGDPVPLVSGPQGASMLVFAARTAGIVPGNPADPVDPRNPEVALTVARAGAEVARYRGRPGFRDAGAGLVEVVDLFVITEGDALVGAALTAHADVTDAIGARRCGDVTFTATR